MFTRKFHAGRGRMTWSVSEHVADLVQECPIATPVINSKLTEERERIQS